MTLSADEVATLLRAPARVLPSGVSTTFDQLREGLHLWFSAHQAGMCTLWGGAEVPDLFGLQDSLRGTLCLMDDQSLVLLAWAAEERREGELVVLAPDGADMLAEVALGTLRDWDGRGRPMDAAAVIRAYPRMRTLAATPADAVMIDQRWTRFVLSWGDQPPAILTV